MRQQVTAARNKTTNIDGDFILLLVFGSCAFGLIFIFAFTVLLNVLRCGG